MKSTCTILSSVASPTLQNFSTLSQKRHDLQKKNWNKMCILSFSTIFVWNIFHSKKKWVRYVRKCILVFMQSTFYCRLILMKHGHLGQFLKIVKYQISWKSIQWELQCSMQTDGWMNRHGRANSHFLQFCERA